MNRILITLVILYAVLFTGYTLHISLSESRAVEQLANEKSEDTYVTQDKETNTIEAIDNGFRLVAPPSTIRGKTFRMTVESATGAFARQGEFTVSFDYLAKKYHVIGDGRHVVDSEGTYTYRHNDKQAIISVHDSVMSQGSFYLVFNSEQSGAFFASSIYDADTIQSGSFEQIQ